MTFNEFIKKYYGKQIDYDGVSGVQCVDLVKRYAKDVLGITPGSWGNAKYYWTSTPSALSKVCKKISNTASFVPQKGDVMVWNGNVGSGCGHVAICTGEGTTSYFYSYDQNWDGKAVKKVKHSYENVYGVLRPTKNINGGVEEMLTTYRNGSTTETVYTGTDCKTKVGSLDTYEVCDCIGEANGLKIVLYKVNGTNNYKVGFVKYAGGVS